MRQAYLVLGAGRAGVSAADALRSRGASSVRIWDQHDGPDIRSRTAAIAMRGVGVELGEWRAELLNGAGTVVKSPGVPATHPAVSCAIDTGIEVIDELELGRRLSRRQLVAVTGTDGKSTVCALLAHALGTPGSPLPVVGNTEFGPPLSAIAPQGRPVVVEASSYQLEFCAGPFTRLAVLTNLTTEHLHRHGTMAAYGAIKRRLFIGERAVPLAVVSADSRFGLGLAAELRAAGSAVLTFGSSVRADYHVQSAAWDVRAASVLIETPAGPVELETRLPGRHNAENVAAALAACDLLGVTRRRSLQAFATMPGVQGRWETVERGQPFDVVVDFAHTPSGLRRTLETGRAVVQARPGARLRLVLCAGGGNNPSKRGPFGAIASELADKVVVTEGNGRGEPRVQVIEQILAGWRPGARPPEVIPNRRQAIGRALRGARPGDLVVVMGRGAMGTLLSNSSGGGLPFDDRRVASSELDQLALENQPVPTRPEEVVYTVDGPESEAGVELERVTRIGSAAEPDPAGAAGAQAP